MPIFHDVDQPVPAPVQYDAALSGDGELTEQLSEQGNRSTGHDGSVQDPDAVAAARTRAIVSAMDNNSLGVADRLELIERIKRGESPTWMPTNSLEEYFPRYNASKAQTRVSDVKSSTISLPLLPAADLRPPSKEVVDSAQPTLASPSEIERPKSALHSGDFTQDSLPSDRRLQKLQPTPYSSSDFVGSNVGQHLPASWNFYASGIPFGHAEQCISHAPVSARPASSTPSLRSRSSSFVANPPTSPLAQTLVDSDIDLQNRSENVDMSRGKAQSARRHTLPPHSLSALQPPSTSQFIDFLNSGNVSPTSARPPPLSLRSHQLRNSLASTFVSRPHVPLSTPAYPRFRRPSLSSETSPLHHASMVGSYEESILRGRMSTAPSRPLNFVAQIGVLGLGDCKPHLRCPAHVSVPFPAVFYSYASAGEKAAALFEDGPSPYVGLIDLENSLKTPDESKEERRRKKHSNCSGNHTRQEVEEDNAPFQQSKVQENDTRLRKKFRRRSPSPKAPPGGSYRIPQKGQVQIVIKNPNKTAVKLFLVPYDLHGMEPGTKTFIRQRSYSAGPIIEFPLGCKVNSESATAIIGRRPDETNERPTLRYLIHLHICCPSRGRFYLYKSIRVVFANRVPDGKEKLRNEIQLPEPRYSTYKPGRDSMAGLGGSHNLSSGHSNALRRRSYAFAASQTALDTVDGISQPPQPGLPSRMTFSSESTHSVYPAHPLPLGNPPSALTSPSASPRHHPMDLDSPPPCAPGAQAALGSAQTLLTRSLDAFTSPSVQPTPAKYEYAKLEKGEVGYGGNSFARPIQSGAELGEGLLARKLRGLDVQRDLDGRDGNFSSSENHKQSG